MAGKQADRERWRRGWDKVSASYDRQIQVWDRLLADSRPWVCSQAVGRTLEVAVGTGLNLPLYPAGVQLTGIDFSAGMLGIARRRAGQLGLAVDLREADAQALPFPDRSFDTVTCTFSLCAIPDDRVAVGEMARVLRPGGLLLLADHVASTAWPVRGAQRVAEVFSVRMQGEHYLRRPLVHVEAEGLTVERRERLRLGVIERVTARRPV
jgi:ubiquinone/menaquinone biosynthesis C-methylase UbiE